ncbi:hypothetical protein AURDEDRAFT_158078 [Auricularia subglabra TFB-10046 SS5]|nr:hypothetical protein AURDEDRAFT_158078 [Auricularia subglabra TFB-10046 SS5]
MKIIVNSPETRDANNLAAIANDADIRNALDALALDGPPNLEKAQYTQPLHLLHCAGVSYKHVLDCKKCPAIIFSSRIDSISSNDCLGLDIRPYLGAIDQLECIGQRNVVPLPKACSKRVQVGEHARLHNAGPADEKHEWAEAYPWLACVALLYDLHRPLDKHDADTQRDRDIRSCALIRDLFHRHDGRCVLLADVGNSSQLDGASAPQAGTPTGTRMFISLELTQPDVLNFLPHKRCMDWLKEDFLEIEQHADEFRRAFPGSDDRFLRGFEEVIQLEDTRQWTTRKAAKPPAGRHDRRHDAESFFWVLLWRFACATPLGAPPTEDATGCLKTFFSDMFHHAN